MESRYQLVYSEELLRSAGVAFMYSALGKAFSPIELLMVGFVVYRIAEGDRSWYVEMLATALVISWAGLVYTYILLMRRARQSYRQMKGQPVTLGLSNDELSLESPNGLARIPWEEIERVAKFRRYWLLMFKTGSYTPISICNLPGEALNFIEARVTNPHGRHA